LNIPFVPPPAFNNKAMITDMFVFFHLLLTLRTAFTLQIGNPMLLSPSLRSKAPIASRIRKHTFRTVLAAEKKDEGGVEEYKNAATSFLANFMQKSDMKGEEPQDPLGNINFDTPKVAKKDLEALAAALDAELYENEWFVTGQVNAAYFSNEFEFQDPGVKLSGIEGAHDIFCFGSWMHSLAWSHSQLLFVFGHFTFSTSDSVGWLSSATCVS
jgi:hypothetical protein